MTKSVHSHSKKDIPWIRYTTNTLYLLSIIFGWESDIPARILSKLTGDKVRALATRKQFHYVLNKIHELIIIK